MSEVETVIAWHTALNEGDLDALVALCTDDVEVGGPNGVTRGAEVLREWYERAGLHLHLQAFLQRREVVVVTQEAVWVSDPETIHQVASVFRVQAGLIASVVRFEDLEAALSAAGMDRR